MVMGTGMVIVVESILIITMETEFDSTPTWVLVIRGIGTGTATTIIIARWFGFTATRIIRPIIMIPTITIIFPIPRWFEW